MPSTPENYNNAQQKQAALDYLQALNKWDFEAVRSRCSDKSDFNYNFRPASLKGFGFPDGMDKEQLITFMHHLKKTIVKDFNFGEPNQLIQSKDEVVVWVRAHGKAINDAPYNNEYIMLISFDPGTDKFLHVVEMMDSLFIEELQDSLKKKTTKVNLVAA